MEGESRASARRLEELYEEFSRATFGFFARRVGDRHGAGIPRAYLTGQPYLTEGRQVAAQRVVSETRQHSQQHSQHSNSSTLTAARPAIATAMPCRWNCFCIAVTTHTPLRM